MPARREAPGQSTARTAEIDRHWTTVLSLPAVRAPNGCPCPSRWLRRPWINSSRTTIAVTIQGITPVPGIVAR